MRHRISKQSFGGRKQGPKKALLRGLVNSLVEHGRIKTTLTKAKFMRSHVEKAITKGKDNTVHSRRVLLSKFPNKNTVNTIVSDLSVRFKERPGGYTRIIKVGPRPGDMADMAYIEFVDYKLPEPKSDETVNAIDKVEVKRQKEIAKAKKAKKKHIRQMQNKSRKINRPK